MSVEDEINATVGTVSDKLLRAQAMHEEKPWTNVIIICNSPDPEGDPSGAGGDLWMLSSTMPDFVRAGLLRWASLVVDGSLADGNDERDGS